ncbi:MAG: hypothetical protein AAFP84_14905 [Actinomycetota bacterium]
MERAPIPPHERSWRHPSELVGQPATTTASTRSTRTLVVATGAVAVTLVAVLAVTVLPRRTPAPVAMSATTLPPFAVAPPTAPVQVDDVATSAVGIGQVRLERAAIASSDGLALTGAPRTIAAPVDAASTADAASGAAWLAEDDPVHLLTSSHVYHLLWADIDRVVAPDGSLVVDATGRMVGTFVDGRFSPD